jgi:hypothetical protein
MKLRVGCLLVAISAAANTQFALGEVAEPKISCDLLDVRTVSNKALRMTNAGFKQDVGVGFVQQLSDGVPSDEVLNVEVIGPILGSMDSRDISLSTRCAADGIYIRAATIRSVNYRGVALKNVLWRPLMSYQIVIHKHPIAISGEWQMFLSDGTPVHDIVSPGLGHQALPIPFRRVIDSASEPE